MKKGNILLMSFLSAFLLAILLFAVFSEQPQETASTDCLQLVLQHNGSTEAIRLWQGEDGMLHAFLPAYVQPEELTVHLSADAAVRMDGTALTQGTVLGTAAAEGIHELEINGQRYALSFHRTAELPAMYIRIGRGGIADVQENKQTQAAAQISLYDSKGQLNYRTVDYRDHISGHGNSTWYPDKKPYTLTLSRPASLLEGSAGKKWILLANYYDQTHMRNFFAHDLANSQSSIWSPKMQFVSLYVDGVYNGLYQLAEKVETGAERTALRQDEVLLCLEILGRQKEYNLGLFADGVVMEIVSPKNLSDVRQTRLNAAMQEVITAVLSGEASEDYLRQHLDLDSWVWKYLLEEIVSSFDAGACSQYLSFDGTKLISQAAWDYDNTLGNTSELTADSFQALREWQYAHTATPWFAALYQYDLFRQMVKTRYREDFLPYIQEKLLPKLDMVYQAIQPSIITDTLRWPEAYARYPSEEAFRQMRDYLTERLSFLSDAWIAEKEYCLVSFVLDPSVYMTVPSGTTLSDMEAASHYLHSAQWYNVKTGERFDPAQPITENISLFPVEAAEDTEAPHWTQDRALLLGIGLTGCLVLAGILLVWVECRRYTRKEKHSDGAAISV